MDLSKDRIIEQWLIHSSELRSLGLVRPGLFGPYVKKESTVNSDIDFIADIEPSEKACKMVSAWLQFGVAILLCY
jgi:predicted nucleotidyltransferase